MLGGLALKWRWRKRRHGRRPARRSAQPGLRPGAGLLGEVRALLRRRAARDPARGRRHRHAPAPAGGATATRTRSASSRRSASPSPASTSRSRRSRPRSTTCSAATGLDIPIHVDAASGGFIAPFVQPDLDWDFRLPRVKSINTSGHKYGLAPLGVGWVVWRDAADLPEELIFRVDYLGGDMPTFALNFSRPGRRDHRAVLQLPPPGPRGLPAHPAGVRRHGAVPRRRGRGDGAVRARSTTAAAACRRSPTR